jgi:predicted DCC family thiol-disulfide oxidoreductase YuxK
VLRIAKDLRFPTNLAYVFMILPAFIRDPIYKFIGKNRYTWFGKKEHCMLPTPDLQARFI